METRKVERITIRWKPYMWWAYINDDEHSHIHGEPEDLLEMGKVMYPDAAIEIDWASKPQSLATPNQVEG